MDSRTLSRRKRSTRTTCSSAPVSRERLRDIVLVAALEVETASVRQWLFLDEYGTWERRAAELVERTTDLAKRQGLTESQQDSQISIFLGYEATLGMLEFAKNEETIHKPAREAAREAEAARIKHDHPPMTRGRCGKAGKDFEENGPKLGLDISQKAPIMVDMSKTSASRVNVTHTPQSSWIRGVAYHDGILIILTGARARSRNRGSNAATGVTTGAILYSGVPSWVVGLLVASQAKSKTAGPAGEPAGRESVGATYSRLVKGKYQGQVVGPEKIGELRKLIGAAK